MKFLLLLAAAPCLWAQDCAIAVTPVIPVQIDAGPRTGTVTVTTSASCAWTWSVDAPWLVPAYGAGKGGATVTWSASANTQPVTRTAVITVALSATPSAASARVTVTQAPPPDCKLALQPPSAGAGETGGTGAFQVQSYCYWSASASAGWISVPSNTGGAASGPVSYTVAANPCVAPRTGSVTVRASSLASAPQSFVVTQDGSPDSLSIAPQSVTVASAASDGRLAVTTDPTCGWSASSYVSWLRIVAGGAGSGAGFLTYHLDENTSGATRTGTLAVGPQAFTVTQQPAPAAVPRVSAVLNAASYSPDTAVSPGAIVAIYGSGLGPVRPATLQLAADGASVARSLGGATVLFDGVPAALTYASAAQINAVTPYAVAGKTSTQLQVQFQGGASAAVTVPVRDATPGIFTLDASGAGQGAVLNEGYAVNGALAPAERGSWVMIFCTGGGATLPASQDGGITTGDPKQLPLLTGKVSVTIGGLPAAVSYSGGAPGAVAGLTQINAQVPAGVVPGSEVPVVVQVGEARSQSRVTIAVR